MTKIIETIEEVEEVTIEMLDEEFEDPKLSESQEIPSYGFKQIKNFGGKQSETIARKKSGVARFHLD